MIRVDCVLSSLKSDIVSNVIGIDFSCDLNDNIATPWTRTLDTNAAHSNCEQRKFLLLWIYNDEYQVLWINVRYIMYCIDTPNDLTNRMWMWIKGASDTYMGSDSRSSTPVATAVSCPGLVQSVYIREVGICPSASIMLIEISGSPNSLKSELWYVCAAPVALPALPESSGASLFIGKFSYIKSNHCVYQFSLFDLFVFQFDVVMGMLPQLILSNSILSLLR